MAQQENKERDRTHATPPGTPSEGQDDSTTPKDPDLYDPVGMAGKQAGIVTEIEQELKTPTQRNGKDGPAEKREGG